MTQQVRRKPASERWGDLAAQLRDLRLSPREWKSRDFELFFEVESVLHLQEKLVSDPATRIAEEGWALLSGYCIPDINDGERERRQCLLIRQRLRYVKTASAWKWWLEQYRDLPKAIRLYEFTANSEGHHRVQQRDYEVLLRPERLMAYEALYTQTEDLQPVEHEDRWAVAGMYTFQVEGKTRVVEISDAMAKFAATASPTRSLPQRTSREPITVDLNALEEIALEIDRLEESHKFLKRGNWYKRMKDLRLTRLVEESLGESVRHRERKFTLAGLFHLVGALGAGKSTLIWVLIYYLACQEGRHITVMMNTVVEAIQFAVWLRRLGVRAAPVLGKNRADHERKYALANAQTLTYDHIFQENPPFEPALRWMPAPCMISGAQKNSIPIGQEPCRRLIDEDNRTNDCPLIPICPVHNLARDLVESQVWIVNPMSFLYSLAPNGLGAERVSMLEAVYRLSDVLVVDEADRVQVQWDRTFAPTQPLAGSDDALLDALRRQVGAAGVGEGRRNAAQGMFNQLTNTDDQANTLSNRAFRLLLRTPRLAKWVKQQHLSSSGLFQRLVNELVQAAPRTFDEDAKKTLAQELTEDFRQLWARPLRSREGFLRGWITQLLGTDANERRLQKQLEVWLAHRMQWQLPLNSRRHFLLRKFEFALIFTAMLKRANDILYQLKWIDDEIGQASTRYTLPDRTVNLVPDPPLGVLLGVRLVQHDGEGNAGVFNAMRYRGVGRWLLLNYPRLYRDQFGWVGPHVLLTSATSWLPGAVQFHLAVRPHALLQGVGTGSVNTQFEHDAAVSCDAQAERSAKASRVDIRFQPIQPKGRAIRVSGAGKRKERNLRAIVRTLATKRNYTPSDLQTELDDWRSTGERRRILLVVNSYRQAEWVLDELEKLPEWRGRVKRLLPDYADVQDESGIRAREVERFNERDADILIAPLMAIQRGFNILDEAGEGALLGTAYFLVRPYPPPDDLSPQVLSMNAWLLNQLQENGRVLNEGYAEWGTAAMRELRRRAYVEWRRRLNGSQGGVAGMEDFAYEEFLRDQFVTIWQTIGRLIRGGRNARVYFTDGAFAPEEGRRRMLLDWHTMLDQLIHTGTSEEKFIANALYGVAWDAFDRAMRLKEIY